MVNTGMVQEGGEGMTRVANPLARTPTVGRRRLATGTLNSTYQRCSSTCKLGLVDHPRAEICLW